MRTEGEGGSGEGGDKDCDGGEGDSDDNDSANDKYGQLLLGQKVPDPFHTLQPPPEVGTALCLHVTGEEPEARSS